MESWTQCPVSHCPEGVIAVFILVFVIFFIFAVLIVTAVKILIACKIFSKAGYSWALGLLMLVPIADIVVVCFLAFSDWPVLKELRQLRPQQEKT